MARGLQNFEVILKNVNDIMLEIVTVNIIIETSYSLVSKEMHYTKIY